MGLPTSRVGYHAGKPDESVVYCLNKQFYQQRHRHLPKMVPLLALINLPLFEAGFSDKQALSVNRLTTLVSCATEFTST